ncbi:uncharacterized protein [Coffea arabica]|uniref:Uncharacterized protein isoform X1 n=1 Tax=Coffea arabica TaxID=13443 RepID=A0A6P6X7E6_COFAR
MAALSSLLKSLSFLSLSDQNPSLSLKPHQNPCSPQLPFSSSSSFPPQFLLSTANPSPDQQSLLNPLPKTPINPQFYPAADYSPSPSFESLIICPSLAYANVYFFKDNFRIVCGENESEHQIADRFMRATARSGVFYEMKRRRFFQTPREEKKMKSQLAAKRLKRSKMRAARFREAEPKKPRILMNPIEEMKRNARIAAKRRSSKKCLLRKDAEEKKELIAKKESYISDDDNWEFVDV